MKSNLILTVNLLAIVCVGSACSGPKATSTPPTSVTASQPPPPAAAKTA